MFIPKNPCTAFYDDTVLPPIEISVIKQNISLRTLAFEKPLAALRLEDLLPQYRLISQQTNDRMKYQHGHFLLFTKAIIYKDEILLGHPTNKEFTKRLIKKVDGHNIVYDQIAQQYPQYQYHFLMEPYDYFR